MAQIDPENINEWFVVGGVVATALLWVYRKLIVRVARWAVDVMSAPGRIERMAILLDEINIHTQTTLALARATWDTIPCPVWHSDLLGKCVHVNLAYRKLLECQFSDVAGEAWRTIIHPGDRQIVFDEWDACIQQRRDFDLVYRWKSRSGNTIHIHARASRIVLPDGTLAGWVAFVDVLPTPSTP